MKDNTYTLKMQRTGVVGAAVQVNYKINNDINGGLYTGKSCEHTLLKETTNIHLFQNIPMGKKIEKDVIIEPNPQTKVVSVNFKCKINWLVACTILGLFKPVSRIEIVSIEYN